MTARLLGASGGLLTAACAQRNEAEVALVLDGERRSSETPVVQAGETMEYVEYYDGLVVGIADGTLWLLMAWDHALDHRSFWRVLTLRKDSRSNVELAAPDRVCSGEPRRSVAGRVRPPLSSSRMTLRAHLAAMAVVLSAWGCGSSDRPEQAQSQAVVHEQASGAAVEDTTTAVPRLSARSDQTCHAMDDGRVRCWGAAALEQTGPSRWGDVADAIQLASGIDTRCVLHRTRLVTCEGPYLGASAPQLAALGNVVMVTGEGRHFCALDEAGRVQCWGSHLSLGRSGGGETDGPVTIDGLPPSRQIAASSEHTCALAQDGSVRCWGRGFSGGLGNGYAPDSAVPVQVEGIEDAIRIDVSYDASCAIGRGGALSCWGRGPVLGSEEPVAITRVASVPDAVDVDVSQRTVCVVDARGAVRCGDHEGLVAIEGVEDAIEVELGAAHGCARSADDTVHCWGARDAGQLGEPMSNTALPSERPAATGIAHIQGGDELVLFAQDGAVLVGRRGRLEALPAARGAVGYARGPRETCWWSAGAVSCVHSGMGAHWTSSEPTPHPELGEVAELAFWRGGGCARAATGSVTCWRMPPFMGVGEVPAPPGLDPTPSPWQGPGHAVPPYRPRAVRALRGVAQLVGTEDQLVARTEASEVRVGLERMRALPALQGASVLVSEQHRTCALREGRVACWHEEDDPIAPSFLDGVEGATQVSVSGSHACARIESGRAMCWGDNDTGALGDGTNTARDGAVFIGGATPITGIVEVAALEDSSCVLLEDHSVRCFGVFDWTPPPEPAASAIRVPAGTSS